MKICVVTATFDRRFLLARRQLLALAAQTFRQFQVVVVDDASMSTDIEALCEPGRWNFPVAYYRNDGLGSDLGRSYRLGCSRVPSTCDLIVVLHGETVLSPNALEEMLGLLEDQHDPYNYAIQAIPENLLSNAGLTDEILLTNFSQVDTFIMESLQQHEDLRWVDGKYETWPGDPFPRRWYPAYETMRYSLRSAEGTLCNYSWADLKRLQHRKQRQNLVVENASASLWNVCCAFWARSVQDMSNAWVSQPKGTWHHEQWNGFCYPVHRLLPSTITVLHQNHFSETEYLSRWPYLGPTAIRNLPAGIYKEPQFRCQLNSERVGYYY